MAGLRLGVFGGTFDPPHIGHMVLAEQAREQLGLQRVLWVPSGNPWRKAARPVTAAADRLEMARLATSGHRAFRVWTGEVSREGPSYTVDTIEELSEKYAGSELYLLLGGDALEDLPNWRRPARIIALARLAVAVRGNTRLGKRSLERLLPGLSKRVDRLSIPRIDVSSTDLRARAASAASLRYLVLDPVLRFIRERKLYTTP